MSTSLLPLLEQQRQLAEQLLQVLEQESQVVLSADLQSMQLNNQDKQRYCEQLSQLESRWPAELQAADAARWMQQQDERLRHSWDRLIEVLRLCRRRNDANGLLIAQQQQQVGQRLRGDDTGATYGAAGEQQNAGSGRWVASA